MSFAKGREFCAVFFLTVLALGLAGIDAFAGANSDGGGHAVVGADGRKRFLDLSDEAKVSDMSTQEYLRELDMVYIPDPLSDPVMGRSAALALEKLHNMRWTAGLIDFSDSLERAFYSIEWRFSEGPIQKNLHDYAVTLTRDTREVVQLGFQTEKGVVVIDREQFLGLASDNDRAAFLVHETFLRKLGMAFPRDILRSIVRSVMGVQYQSLTYSAEFDERFRAIDKSYWRSIFANDLKIEVSFDSQNFSERGSIFFECQGVSYSIGMFGDWGFSPTMELVVPQNPVEIKTLFGKVIQEKRGKKKEIPLPRCENDPRAKVVFYGPSTVWREKLLSRGIDVHVYVNGIPRFVPAITVGSELIVPVPVF